ncbi:MAG: hypothetical protein ABSH40_11230 [Bryobacteraceae bacterium]|jgi:hypothetical protein
MKIGISGAALGLILWPAQAAPLRPSETEAAREVEKTRTVAADYTKRLPDFICTETIRRYIRVALPKTWQPADILTIKLSFSGQAEDHRLVQINGQPADEPEESLDGLVNIGEFGGMLEAVFGRATQAVFHWEGWKTVRNRPAAVYSYQVEKAHSLYMLTFDPGGYQHRQVVAYHGVVEVDWESGGVLRLVYEAGGIPKDFPMQYARTTVDYDFAEVAGRRYLLPVKSETETGSVVLRARNIVKFEEYRKFSADSTIRFGDAEKQ